MARGLTVKGQILDFIKEKPRRWTEIVLEFNASGHTVNLVNELIRDELIYKPSRGLYEVRPKSLKSPTPK